MINRRTFNTAMALGAGAAAVPPAGPQGASSATPARSATAGTHTRFTSLKQVKAGVLNVGYTEQGPAHGPVVICLHGWPYDIHSYADAAPLLAAAGYRVIVPYLRGHGTTRFLSSRTVRNGQQSAIALDIIALMDALHIHKAVIAGFDWGSRTGGILAALWPERVKALVSVSGYLITDRKAQLEPLAAAAEHTWWYQFYFATERGKKAMEDHDHRLQLTRLVWELVSPTWNFDDATFARTAAAFDNPDYAAIVIHNYRWRLSVADGERRYDRYEEKLATAPSIAVPTITLDPEKDPFTLPGDGSMYRDKFTGKYEHRTLTGIGHNLPQEAPTAFAQAVVDADRL
ncbi:pimeloyl-ACP methyl ester carboxylesterase [Streptomyces griseochromogenes]|uniref:Alpha/beta hydrolase n=1 Tax=Streptomyces griseochromogenes TaxID=68214 RepID=A0A1B1B2H2_9ACTN|nr:alpha/beta hydrolase [Streptomyces griseochromogenes]ANP53013.1 alpha/beta hydrolase [Streptomyces griseochromogenes]MBP2047680.1 pimeloyl-ACP methyl ester carboxylesterase [Streptomyces griseochromogenes]